MCVYIIRSRSIATTTTTTMSITRGTFITTISVSIAHYLSLASGYTVV